jgi:hypothetical protein
MNGFFRVIFKKNGGELMVTVPPKRIFEYPNDEDDPLIFWVWEYQFKPAFKCKRGKKDIVVMNFYSLKDMEDTPKDIADCGIYLSAVLVEELSHCATKSMRGHKGWIDMLTVLQQEF